MRSLYSIVRTQPRRQSNDQIPSRSMAATYPLNMDSRKASRLMMESLDLEAAGVDDTSPEGISDIITTSLEDAMSPTDISRPEDIMMTSQDTSRSEVDIWAEDGTSLDIAIAIVIVLALRLDIITIHKKETLRTCQYSRLSSSYPMSRFRPPVSTRSSRPRSHRGTYQERLPVTRWQVSSKEGRKNTKKGWSRSNFQLSTEILEARGCRESRVVKIGRLCSQRTASDMCDVTSEIRKIAMEQAKRSKLKLNSVKIWTQMTGCLTRPRRRKGTCTRSDSRMLDK